MCADDIVHPVRHQSSIQELLNGRGEAGQKGCALPTNDYHEAFIIIIAITVPVVLLMEALKISHIL